MENTHSKMQKLHINFNLIHTLNKTNNILSSKKIEKIKTKLSNISFIQKIIAITTIITSHKTK